MIICEPQCIGFEHSDVNAALLENILNIHNPVIFIAESSHIDFIKKSLKKDSLNKIEFIEIIVPNKNLPDIYKLPLELTLLKNVFRIAKLKNINHYFFTSITSTALQVLKIYIFFNKKMYMNVILHGNLEGLNAKISYRPWVYIFWIKHSLLFLNSHNLKIIVLGEHIKLMLGHMYPKINNYIYFLNMPYFFRCDHYNIPLSNVLVFGFLGVASEKKGATDFMQIATEFSNNKFHNKSVFKLIGHITDSNLNHDHFYECVKPTTISNKPLTIESFINEAKAIDYSVFCFPDSAYQLSCSATFFDAISFIKPIIAIKTPFFEFYFKKFGDIGYLCENIEEMKCLISSLLTNFDKKRYDRQCQNILLSRHEIGLTTTTKQIKNILNF
jgi:hypothetical protein